MIRIVFTVAFVTMFAGCSKAYFALSLIGLDLYGDNAYYNISGELRYPNPEGEDA